MHKHWCDVVGHEYQCADESCGCVCGEQMEGHNHENCPIELRACPEHPERSVDNSVQPDPGSVQIDLSVLSPERQQSVPTCHCGCAELAPDASFGFCAWCTHRYADYSPRIEADHFLNDCPEPPEQLRESALKRLTKRSR